MLLAVENLVDVSTVNLICPTLVSLVPVQHNVNVGEIDMSSVGVQTWAKGCSCTRVDIVIGGLFRSFLAQPVVIFTKL